MTVTGRKRRRMPTVVQSESEEDDSDSEAGRDDELGTGLEPEIRARGRGRGRNRVESDDESEGEGVGGVKRRCQEGAAEARGSVVGPAELLQGLGTQTQGHPGAGRRGRRQPPGCQGVAPFLMEGAPTLWAGPPRGAGKSRLDSE